MFKDPGLHRHTRTVCLFSLKVSIREQFKTLSSVHDEGMLYGCGRTEVARLRLLPADVAA